MMGRREQCFEISMPLMDGGPDQDLNLVGKFIKAPSFREAQKSWSAILIMASIQDQLNQLFSAMRQQRIVTYANGDFQSCIIDLPYLRSFGSCRSHMGLI